MSSLEAAGVPPPLRGEGRVGRGMVSPGIRAMSGWLRDGFRFLVALALIGPGAWWFSHHYRLFDERTFGERRCLPFRFYLVDLTDHTLKRGDYVVFTAQRMEPFYAAGTLVAKRVKGVPGDHVLVNGAGVWVNGAYSGALLHARVGERLWRMGHRPEEFARDERVPAHDLWVMGTHPRSFDSRYWGYVRDEQIVGRAIPLW